MCKRSTSRIPNEWNVHITKKHLKTIKLKWKEKVSGWQTKWRQINRLSFHLLEVCLYLAIITDSHIIIFSCKREIFSFVCDLLFYCLLQRHTYRPGGDKRSEKKKYCSFEFIIDQKKKIIRNLANHIRTMRLSKTAHSKHRLRSAS